MRVCEWLRYRRWRARVMATYIRRRSSSMPPGSVNEFSCGKMPSSRPVMNTQSNSSPFDECTVMSCTASCPAWAWLSPDSSAACVKKATSGLRVSPVSLSGAKNSGSGSSSSAAVSRPWLAGDWLKFPPSSSTGKATTSRPKPSCPTNDSAALTNSAKFSSRSWPSFSSL